MNKKDELLNIALKLFADHGYDAIGIQRIVEEASVKKPTLYYYFKSKEGLLTEIVKSKFDTLMHNLIENAQYNGDLVTTLENVVKTFFDFVKNEQVFYRLFLTMSASSKESRQFFVIEPHEDRLNGFITNIFIKAANEHGNLREKEEQLSISFVGIINAYVQLFLHDKLELDNERYFSVTKQFMHGIFS